jgi:DNA-binding response OmpR family regulator
MTSILVVEDEDIILRNIARCLRKEGYKVLTANDRASARQIFRERGVNALCLDINLPDGNGLDLLMEFRKTIPSLPTVVVSASSSKADRDRAAKLEVHAYLTKPFALADLAQAINQCLDTAPKIA